MTLSSLSVAAARGKTWMIGEAADSNLLHEALPEIVDGNRVDFLGVLV